MVAFDTAMRVGSTLVRVMGRGLAVVAEIMTGNDAVAPGPTVRPGVREMTLFVTVTVAVAEL